MRQRPWRLLLREIAHGIAERAFQLAMRLRMAYGRRDQLQAQALAEHSQHRPLQMGAVVKKQGGGDPLPVPHRGEEGLQGETEGLGYAQVAEDIGACRVIEEGQLVRTRSTVREDDLLHEVAVPEAMGVVAFIEAPHRPRHRGTVGSVEGLFESCDGRMTDDEVIPIAEIPSETPRTEKWGGQNRLPDPLLVPGCQAMGMATGRFALAHTREAPTLAEALDGAEARCLCPEAAPNAGGTPRRIALTQRVHRGLLLRWDLCRRMRGTARLILERLLEGSQRSLAKPLEIAAADPALGHDLWHWGPAEEGRTAATRWAPFSGMVGSMTRMMAFSSSWITGGATVMA